MLLNSKPLRILALLWIIGVSGYFIYDLYQGIRYGLYQNGVNQGYATAVNELITKVSGKCDAPTPITAGDKKVEVVDVSCLKSTTNTPPSIGPATATGSTQTLPAVPPKLK
jgi:hypothetical protein